MSTQPSITAILSQTEIFEGLSRVQYELVTYICEPAKYDKGRILVRENERSDDMYVIGQGGVEVLMDPGLVDTPSGSSKLKPTVLTELREGQAFGEVALVDQGLRSATVRVSRNKTLLLRIERERLMLLCDTYPELGYKIMKNLAADLAMKIRNTGLTFRQHQLLLSQVEGN
jgi:CRP-like cAMP-binding protein